MASNIVSNIVSNNSGPGPTPIPTRSELVLIGSFETPTPQVLTATGDIGKQSVIFGAGGTTSGGEFTVDPSGIVTTNAPASGFQYQYVIGLRIGRAGSPGVSIPLVRFMYAADGIVGNAVQVGGTFSVEIDDPDTTWKEVFNFSFTPAIGSVGFVEIARDEAGHNSGNLQCPQPTGTLSTWNPVAVARIEISLNSLVV